MASFDLRRAGPEDAALLSRLKIATFRLTYRGILPDDMLAALDADNDHVGVGAWRARLLDDRWSCFVVEAGEPAGLLVLGPASPDHHGAARGLLDQLYLLPSWHGRGWGGLLWRRAVETFGSTNRLPFAVAVFEGNDPARRLYESLGGRRITINHVFDWKGSRFHELIYLVNG